MHQRTSYTTYSRYLRTSRRRWIGVIGRRIGRYGKILSRLSRNRIIRMVAGSHTIKMDTDLVGKPRADLAHKIRERLGTFFSEDIR